MRLCLFACVFALAGCSASPPEAPRAPTAAEVFESAFRGHPGAIALADGRLVAVRAFDRLDADSLVASTRLRRLAYPREEVEAIRSDAPVIQPVALGVRTAFCAAPGIVGLVIAGGADSYDEEDCLKPVVTTAAASCLVVGTGVGVAMAVRDASRTRGAWLPIAPPARRGVGPPGSARVP